MGKQKYNLIDGFEETAAEMYKSGKTLQEIANIIGTYCYGTWKKSSN